MSKLRLIIDPLHRDNPKLDEQSYLLSCHIESFMVKHQCTILRRSKAPVPMSFRKQFITRWQADIYLGIYFADKSSINASFTFPTKANFLTKAFAEKFNIPDINDDMEDSFKLKLPCPAFDLVLEKSYLENLDDTVPFINGSIFDIMEKYAESLAEENQNIISSEQT